MSSSDIATHADKLQILDHKRSLAKNTDLFYRQVIDALADIVSLEQFHTICDAALKTADEGRSFHEA